MRSLGHLVHASLHPMIEEKKFPQSLFCSSQETEALGSAFQNHGVQVLQRQASRGIILQGEQILMMYTQRYDDFSFPGGGIDPGEDPQHGLRRELREEAGAADIHIIAPFGRVTEFQPTWKKDWDFMHQTSYWYQCALNQPLVANQLEHYEVANGMAVQWIGVDEAIRHNRAVMAKQPASMGLSIGRETLVLERVAEELLAAS